MDTRETHSEARWHVEGGRLILTGSFDDASFDCGFQCQGGEPAEACIAKCEQDLMNEYGKKEGAAIPFKYAFTPGAVWTSRSEGADPNPVPGKKVRRYPYAEAKKEWGCMRPLPQT